MPGDDETRFQSASVDGSAAAADGVPSVGQMVAGKYRVDSVLGRGGMGVVLAVTHLKLGEPYAMKCLLPRGASDPETVERFMREARASVRIKSEHIARVSDVGVLESGAPYILMEHLRGEDLAERLAAHGPLAVGDAVEYVLHACMGIAEAHALGIVHRDLKPSNLFLTQRLDGVALVKVLDFGISKAMGDGPAQSASLTQTTSVFGSPAYMSPEQIRSAKNVDVRTDVWSLGVILYELLAGQLPFLAETAGGVLSAVAADDPAPLRVLRPDVPQGLEAVVLRCLEKKVAKRFQSVSELSSALAPFAPEKSLVSLGRIRRLSVVPYSDPALASPTGSLAPESGARGADSSSVAVIGAATEKPWTTTTMRPKRGRALGAVAIVGALGCVGGGLYVVARSPARSRDEAPPLSGGVPAKGAARASGDAGAGEPAASAQAAAPRASASTRTTEGVAPAPSAVAARSAAAAGAKVAPAGRTPAAHPSGATPLAATAAMPLAATAASPTSKPSVPLDPTSESH